MNPLPTKQLSNNLFAVKTWTVNFYVINGNGAIICIDSGFIPYLIKKELKNIGIHPKDITHLLLTHSDVDHIGGLELFENAKIYLPIKEEIMINRQIPRKFGFIYNPKIHRPYTPLKDGDTLKIGQTKIQAIATPGHTPGSMSYLVDNTLLFVGDTFKLINNKVFCISSRFSMNTEQQKNP